MVQRRKCCNGNIHHNLSLNFVKKKNAALIVYKDGQTSIVTEHKTLFTDVLAFCSRIQLKEKSFFFITILNTW